jgi:hypothetical protein
MEQIKKLFFIFLLFLASPASAAITDIKFGQYQIADSQWNVSACLYTDTCQIYSKNPGTAYQIPWTSGQIQWAAGDYVKFELSNDASYPYVAKQYDSAGNVKATMGTGKIVNMGPDYFFFVGNDNNTGQLFSGSSGMSDTAGVSWTGTLNPTIAEANAYADATYSTVPLSSGETATVTPSSGSATTACNPCSPQADNLGFETGTTANWTISNGTGTEKTSAWSSNGEGVQTSTGVSNYSPGGGKTWNIAPYGNHMMVIQAGGGSPTFDSAAASLGLTAEQVQDIKTFLQNQGGNSNPTNASWAKRTVTLEAGKTYVVAWQYLSTDYVPFNDGSMMTLVGPSVPTLNNENKNYALLGFTNPGTGNYSTDSYGATGWQLATITVTVSGDYELGFASFNLGDTALSPILFVDDLQGTTTLNGTVFDPVPPNPGSSAPSTGGTTPPALCCGGSSAPFDPNVNFSNRASVWDQQNGNKVIIEQIGNYNSTTVTQNGRKNYTELHINGSNNSTTVNQTSNNSTNYIEGTITGSNNTFNLNQNSTGNVKGIYLISNDNNNSVTVNQSNDGNHYAEINISGGNKSVSLTQEGSTGHRAKIELSGGETSLTATQSGSTQQFYSITHNCVDISCGTITVTQP